MNSFENQEAVIQWLRDSGVRIEYDAASGRWSFPSNDLYDLLKSLQKLGSQRRKPERKRATHQIAAKPLAALEAAEGVIEWAIDHGAQSEVVLTMIREVLAKADVLAA